MKHALYRYAAPEWLRHRIAEGLPLARRVPLQAAVHSASRGFRGKWQTAGLAFASGALLSAVALSVRPESGPGDLVAQEVVANHVRSLMADHLSDVVSTDRQAVKSWFAGRLDYAPAVGDMSAEGYALVGGRLDYVAGRAVAAVVYSHAKHVVNVFACPLEGRGGSDRSVARRGFNAVGWSDAAMQYWVVTDLGMDELHRFAGGLRRAAKS